MAEERGCKADEKEDAELGEELLLLQQQLLLLLLLKELDASKEVQARTHEQNAPETKAPPPRAEESRVTKSSEPPPPVVFHMALPLRLRHAMRCAAPPTQSMPPNTSSKTTMFESTLPP